MNAVAVQNTMRLQSLRYVALFIAFVLQVTNLYSYIKTLQLSTRSWLLSASFLSWGLFRKRNKWGGGWGRVENIFVCNSSLATFAWGTNDFFQGFFLYKTWKHLVGGEDEEHSHTHSDTQSLTSSNGPFSIPNKYKLPRWILSALRGANIVSVGKNVHWNLVICKEPEWYIETCS